MRVDAVVALLVGEGGEVGAEHGFAVDAELLGDGCAGDDVVAGDHADPDVGSLRVRDGGFGFFAGRVDHGDQAGHFEVVNVAEQVAVGIEVGGVEVAVGGGHDP